MLGLPQSTEVNRRITKEKLYQNASFSPKVRDLIKSKIESIIWRNKFSNNTVGISAGESIKEIQVIEIQLRQRELDKRILPAIAKAIPYNILFILVHSNEVQAWIEVSNRFYNTDWRSLDDFALKFEGLNLDIVYENLVRQVAGGRLGLQGDIIEAVDRDIRRQILKQNISILEKKLLKERQYNRQIELNGELKLMQVELKEMME